MNRLRSKLNHVITTNDLELFVVNILNELGIHTLIDLIRNYHIVLMDDSINDAIKTSIYGFIMDHTWIEISSWTAGDYFNTNMRIVDEPDQLTKEWGRFKKLYDCELDDMELHELLMNTTLHVCESK
jgi:hypothetical protein